MSTILLITLFAGLAVFLLDGDWRGGLVYTLVIGFLQDPLRKITPEQPTLYVGLVLIAFSLCAVVIYEQKKSLNLRAMCWTAPELRNWLSLYVGLIVLQALNSFLVHGSLLLPLVGSGFYLAPLLGLWMGFEVGCQPGLLRRLLTTYVLLSAVYAVTIWLSYKGFNHPLLKEVGKGIVIDITYGLQVQGASGLWRTSELAAMHLGVASSLATTLGFSSRSPEGRIGWILLGIGFAFLTIITGRRKALVLVLCFLGLYLLLLNSRTSATERERVFSGVFGSIALAFAAFNLFLISSLGENFGKYFGRFLTSGADLIGRFQQQGIDATLRSLEISQGFGLGVGSVAQLGSLRIQRASVASRAFVSESGTGRFVAELGLPGIVLLSILIYFSFLLIRRNLQLITALPQPLISFYIGLLAFGLANIPFFIAAGGIYSDPFVLLMISLCLGGFTSIPSLIAQQSATTAPTA